MLEPLHLSGLGVRLVIESAEVQNAVHKKMRKMIAQGLALNGGLSGDGLSCQRNITQTGATGLALRIHADPGFGLSIGERENVGGAVSRAKNLVEPADDRVICQQNRELRGPSLTVPDRRVAQSGGRNQLDQPDQFRNRSVPS